MAVRGDAGVGALSAYEVRCPRCDVSFPVETKICFHCGGRTGPGRVQVPEVVADVFEDSGYEIGTTGGFEQEPPRAIDVLADSPFGSAAGSDEPPTFDSDRAAPTEEGTPPFAKSLLRSLPSVIWVLLLVGFSLARSCGE